MPCTHLFHKSVAVLEMFLEFEPLSVMILGAQIVSLRFVAGLGLETGGLLDGGGGGTRNSIGRAPPT